MANTKERIHPMAILIKYLPLILLLILALFICLLFVIVHRIIHPPQESYAFIEKDIGHRLGYSSKEASDLFERPYEVLEIQSNYGYKLAGRYFNHGGKACVIWLHREGRNLMAAYKYLNLYRDLGYDVLAIDARSHGRSGGDNYSYGYFERWDLQNWVHFLKGRSPDLILGFHGESSGAATALMTLSEEKDIAFAIADSSFTELLEVMRTVEAKVLKSRSKKLLVLINQIIKRRAGFSLTDVSPLTEIQALEVPVLFLHSEADEWIPSRMSRILAAFKSGYNQIFIAPGSPHLLGYYQHQSQYEAEIKIFLDHVEKQILRHGRSYL